MKWRIIYYLTLSLLLMGYLGFIHSSGFIRQVSQSLRGINYCLIRLVADKILLPYRTEKLDTL
jgi:hypothetical protein